MRPIKTTCIHALLAKRVFLPAAVTFLIFSVSCSFAQIDPAQLTDRNSSRSQTVSKNALLAPVKALNAIERARKDFLAGRREAAQKEITRALEIAPHFAIAEVLQGALDLETQDFEGATTFFQRAINDDPASGGAYVGMAVILIHNGRFQAALPLLDRADGLLPGTWFVHFAKATAHLALGDTGAALKQADCAEQIAGTDSERKSGVAYLRAMISIHMSDLNTAREHLLEAVARSPRGDYAALAKRALERLQPPPLTASR